MDAIWGWCWWWPRPETRAGAGREGDIDIFSCYITSFVVFGSISVRVSVALGVELFAAAADRF